MKRVLIDTDVILDFFFDREPFSEAAAKILSLCELNLIQGYITPIMISNIYYLLRKNASHEKVIEKLKMLISITDLLVTDKTAVNEALNSDFKDFEDALQNYSAESNNGIDVIITRNIKDYKHSRIAIMNPIDYLMIVDK